MEKLIRACRIALGIIVLTYGLNIFLQFMPMPRFSVDARAFMDAIITAGYLMPIVGALMMVCGIFLVGNSHVPFVLLVLAPISVNALLFHVFLDIKTLAPAACVFILNTFLIYQERGEYEHLMRA